MGWPLTTPPPFLAPTVYAEPPVSPPPVSFHMGKRRRRQVALCRKRKVVFVQRYLPPLFLSYAVWDEGRGGRYGSWGVCIEKGGSNSFWCSKYDLTLYVLLLLIYEVGYFCITRVISSPQNGAYLASPFLSPRNAFLQKQRFFFALVPTSKGSSWIILSDSFCKNGKIYQNK